MTDTPDATPAPAADTSINIQTGQHLLSFIERIERLEEEIAGLNGDKSEVYAEAKSNGFDRATLRKIVSLRKADPAARQEADALLETYLFAIEQAEASRAPGAYLEASCGTAH